MNNFLFGLIGLLLLAIVGVGAFALYNSNNATSAPSVATQAQDTLASTQEAPAQATSTSTQTTSSSALTMAVVAQHNSAASCYTAIGGSVYDLTGWINQHPGGRAAILSLCGVDGTAAFNAQHGGQRRPEQELASLKIGVLQ